MDLICTYTFRQSPNEKKSTLSRVAAYFISIRCWAVQLLIEALMRSRQENNGTKKAAENRQRRRPLRGQYSFIRESTISSAVSTEDLRTLYDKHNHNSQNIAAKSSWGQLKSHYSRFLIHWVHCARTDITRWLKTFEVHFSLALICPSH